MHLLVQLVAHFLLILMVLIGATTFDFDSTGAFGATNFDLILQLQFTTGNSTIRSSTGCCSVLASWPLACSMGECCR